MTGPAGDGAPAAGGERGRLSGIEAQIGELFAEHDRRWGRLDFPGVAALWDAAEPLPVYLGEEYAGPQIGWPDLNRHWARLASRLQAATLRSQVVRVDEPAPELARAVVLSAWSLTGVESPEARTGRSWVTCLLRRRPDGWRILHYMEAPVYFQEALDL